MHDSKVVTPLLEDKDKGQNLYLDAGYEGQKDVVEEHGMTPIICEKGHRNHPLTEEQKNLNSATVSINRLLDSNCHYGVLGL